MIKSLPLLVFALPLIGCGTVDQVPLVYVSTVKVGINAETGTTANPGGKVVIGVDATDAAYVPIAVARQCDKSQVAQCPEGQFPVTLVHGDNSFSPAEFVRSARTVTDRLRDIAEAIKLDQDALSAAIGRESQAELADAQRRTAEAALNTYLAAHPQNPSANGANTDPALPPNPPVDEELQQLKKSVADNQGAEAALKDAKAKTEAARTALNQKMAEFTATQRSLSEALARTPDSIGTRTDALSVFGSFDANAKGGGSAEANIVLGKSFSTGVAAQLLTEGLSRASSAAAVTKCLQTATLAAHGLDGPVKEGIIAEGIKACRTGRE